MADGLDDGNGQRFTDDTSNIVGLKNFFGEILQRASQ
jgi:hypothetical protein